jgi:hypothetical protein
MCGDAGAARRCERGAGPATTLRVVPAGQIGEGARNTILGSWTEPPLRWGELRPSAQAACARNSGSESDNAAVNAGTASGDPQLPSPTHTLRAKPARPARRIAEPLVNASQAASTKAILSSSTSEGASVPGCDDPPPGCTPNGDSPGERAQTKASPDGATVSSKMCTAEVFPSNALPTPSGARPSSPRRR